MLTIYSGKADMKFKVKKTDLLPLLTRVNNVIEKKSTQKIRTHILLNAASDNIQLVGFDSEMKVSGSVEGDIEVPGSTTVTSQTLFDVIRSLGGDDIVFNLQDNSLEINSGHSQFHLATIAAEDYPLPDSYQFTEQLQIAAPALVELLHLVKFSMAVNDVRHYLNGLLLHFLQDRLISVSTDGHRLSIAEIQNPSAITDKKAILPRKTVQEVTLWLDGKDGLVSVNISETHIQFMHATTEITSTLINADYPAYETVIPELSENIMTIPKEPLKQALNRAKILTSEYGMGVSMVFSSWQLQMSTNNMDNESTDETLDINYEGDTIKTAFNINYLLNITDVVNSDNLTFSLQDSNSSCIIYDADKENARYVVMPMNI